jgi:hypothetical protein
MGAGPRRSSGRFEKGGRCHNARGLHTEHSKACKRLRCAAPPVHLPKPQQILYTSSGRETKQLEERPAPTRFGGASPSGSMLGPFMVHHSWAEEARWSTTAGRFSVKQSRPFLATGNFVRRDSRTYSFTLKSVSRGPSPCHDFYILDECCCQRGNQFVQDGKRFLWFRAPFWINAGIVVRCE